jgi:hypothetical protein
MGQVVDVEQDPNPSERRCTCRRGRMESMKEDDVGGAIEAPRERIRLSLPLV